jgi:hypothetical protein
MWNGQAEKSEVRPPTLPQSLFFFSLTPMCLGAVNESFRPTTRTMDPLSGTATNVTTVVQIPERIISLCKAYLTAIHDAPSDLRTILIAVGGVKCVLEVLELLTSSPK